MNQTLESIEHHGWDLRMYLGVLSHVSRLGTFHILGNALVSWSCKQRACVVVSTIKVEGIVVGNCCA